MKVTMTELLARGTAVCAVMILAAGAAFADGPVTYQSNATLASAFSAVSECGVAAPGCGVAANPCVSCGDPCDAGCATCVCCREGLLARFVGLFDGDEPCNHCSDGFLLGLFAPTDSCYNDFISPMTNPVFFEDPRTLSEVRLIFLNQKVPLAVGGGDLQLYALQVRAALNDRVSIIANKTGYITSTNPLIDDGWADIAAGLKVNLLKNPETQRLLSAGFTFELTSGSAQSLQGNGDGVLNLFGTYGEQVGSHAHWLSAMGVALPLDDDAESTLFYWSNHLDYHLGGGLYVLGEVNWYDYLSAGAGGIPGIEGGDLFNFGSAGVAGNDIVTAAIGLKAKPYDDMEVGVAWEVPVTNRRDVLDNRLTVDVILRY